MLPLEKNLIKRLGDAGWVLYWLPRLHTLSKSYTIQAPPYLREAHLLVKKITTDIENHHRKEKRDLDKRKNLPIDNPKHLPRHKYTQLLGTLNKQRNDQKPNFVQDNILIAAKNIEFNILFDTFEAGLAAYSTGDYTQANMARFVRRFVEQNNPPQTGEMVGALYYETRRTVKHKRRDWVPGEMGYIREFIRNVKMHYKRIGKIGFWDGVTYHASLSSAEPPTIDSEKQANVTEITPDNILKLLELFYFKFEHHPEFPLDRKEYERLKKTICANYDYSSQIRTEQLPSGILSETYVKPAISSIKNVEE